MTIFNHFNFNVLDLDKSIRFYEEALDLHPIRKKEAEDGSFTLVFLGDESTDFSLELTWLKDRKKPYDLGECEFHLAFVTDEYETMHLRHKEMGCIVYENEGMGVYFIADPDGYWIEMIPKR